MSHLTTAEEFSDDVLRKFNKEYVMFSREEKEENTRIAVDFVKQFCEFREEASGLPLTYVTQGSSFEGIKVDEPDEFDFLLLLLDRPSASGFIPGDSHPITREMKELKERHPVLRGYQPTSMSRKEENNKPEYAHIRQIWPGDAQRFGCLSAAAAVLDIRDHLKEFELAIAYGKVCVGNVNITRIEPPVIHQPALTTVLYKPDGTKISIDMSPCVRFIHNESGEYRYFIAKKKPVLKGEKDERLRFLWLSTYSQDEMKLINRKTAYERCNYRIVKRLFEWETANNSYIWKTIFMKQNEKFSESPTEFIQQMLGNFRSYLLAELDHRRGTGGCSLLTSKFGGYENILARYETHQLYNWFRRFEHLHDLLCDKEYEKFLTAVGICDPPIRNGTLSICGDPCIIC